MTTDKIARILTALEGRARRAAQLLGPRPPEPVGVGEEERLEGGAGRAEPNGVETQSPDADSGIVPLARFFPEAEPVRNAEGVCTLRRARLPLTGGGRFGSGGSRVLLDGCVFPFHPVLGAPPDAMADALREVLAFYPSGSSEHPSGRLAPDDIVFIDVETTGLSGGAGTYPFLVGVGRMELGKNAFVIEQLFMEDYDQERAQLAALADRVADAGAIVTFNGRSFDIPLLCNRLIFHRMNHRLLEKPHADLLHPARRLWRRRLPSCTLQALEAELFGLRREGDVPGEMIPQIFFDYVRGRRPEAIAPVIAHNAQDVVTMAGLLLLIGGLIARAENLPDGFGHELLGLARMLNRRGERRRAAACRERAAGDLTEPDLQAAALFDLGLDYKRMEQWRDALEAFESAARIAPPELSLRARVEMSKIYEHRTHQHADALRTVNAALDYLQQHRELLFYTTGGMADDADHTDLWTAWRNALLHRRTRLQKKLARCEVVS